MRVSAQHHYRHHGQKEGLNMRRVMPFACPKCGIGSNRKNQDQIRF
jgi:hypothetical protein